ncbi:hypothetical protein PYJP_08190 [Pyrofollis japonicus]|nr:hypothetical protein PYJP_08190 [Pyrofollis japonicus]
MALDKRVLRIVVIFGVVSLLADMSYEGFRSILAPLIERSYELGAVVGIGEVIAWGLRPLTGVIADITARYWLLTITGYALVPVGILIAVQGWPWLAIGYSIERFGKALRSPARDYLLSSIAGKRRGLVFGIHELLDQVGAVLGPMMAALAFMGYYGLWVLSVPGAFSVVALLYAMDLYPKTAMTPKRHSIYESFKGGLWPALYVFLAGTMTANPIAIQEVAKIILSPSKAVLAMLYAAAMLSDAAAAIPLGALYDRAPRAAALLPPLFGILAGLAALAMGHSVVGIVLASLLSGVAIAGYETVARAMVKGGATGYGVFGLSYGAATAASIIIYSLLAIKIGRMIVI